MAHRRTPRADRVGRSIRNQALFALLLLGAAIGQMALQLSAYGEAAINADPTPLIPGLVLAGIASLLLVVARIRQMFHSPRDVAEDMASSAVKKLVESLLS